MLGRTHGQPGLPITFGFKAALWAAEVRRHLERIEQAEPRLAVGQLAGAVGTLSAWGEHGPELQRRLLGRLGLGVPDASWLVARDRIAEYVGAAGPDHGHAGQARQRGLQPPAPRAGRALGGADARASSGSITMPQKRNPERSEHLWTLARIVRAGAGLALEGLVGEHERDGAAWKTEWIVLPQASAATAAALAFARELVEGLRVDADRGCARTSTPSTATSWPSRRCSRSRARIGKHRAHELVHRAALAGVEAGVTLEEALAGDAEIAAALPREELAALLAPERALGAAGATVDAIFERGERRDDRAGRPGRRDAARRGDAAARRGLAAASPRLSRRGRAGAQRARAGARGRRVRARARRCARCCTAGSGSPTSPTSSRWPRTA